MSDSIQHNPHYIYANALRNVGLLASWTYNRDGIVVLPETTSSVDPEKRIPICVEYMDDTDLDRAYKNTLLQASSLGKDLAKDFKGMTSSFKRSRDNFFVTTISTTFTVAANQIASSSMNLFQYAFGGMSVISAGITVFWLRQYFKESSELDQNLIALKVVHNNFALCEGELKKRGVITVIEAQPD